MAFPECWHPAMVSLALAAFGLGAAVALYGVYRARRLPHRVVRLRGFPVGVIVEPTEASARRGAAPTAAGGGQAGTIPRKRAGEP